MLRPLGIPIAVITNSSLVWRADVRADLCKADWVSLKLDAVDEAAWHRTNRPLAIPTRPPAETWVRPPEHGAINQAYQIFSEKLAHVEYLIGYEGNAFAHTSAIADDLGYHCRAPDAQ
jgi:wyosine [tRNA(Phe)-imidazoG37] synthetase (radical SAM superfamily)